MVAKYRISFLLGLLAVALTLVPGSTADSSSTQRLTDVETLVVREINRVRAEHGLRALRMSAPLRTAALGHTQSMLRIGFFDHTSPDGTTFDRRIVRTYSPRPNRRWAVGETLFMTSGTLTARETVAGWLDSPGHRAILLSAQWREIGIGVARSPLAAGDFGNQPATVATADFGAR